MQIPRKVYAILSGEKILAILVKLLAEQESVEITYELKK